MSTCSVFFRAAERYLTIVFERHKLFEQSFSLNGFKKIYEADIRRGGSIEVKYFERAYKIRLKIVSLNRFAGRVRQRYKSGGISKLILESKINKINNCVELRRKQYDDVVTNELTNVLKVVGGKGYSIKLLQLPDMIKGKYVYSIGNQVESVFVSKAVQNTLRNIYDVRVGGRDIIVSRLKALVSDASPKIIFRGDLESFYESINHEMLMSILHSSPKISVAPRRIISQLIREYQRITGKQAGLPRGVGISAYLSEIYMKHIDEQMRNMSDVIYYDRYVDDFVIVFAPSETDNISKYQGDIESLISKSGLVLNNEKSRVINLYNNENGNFDYLGYKFKISTGTAKIGVSQSKQDKIKRRINLAFDDYHKKMKRTPRKAADLITLRIKFLTGNTRLHNSKAGAFIGIYFGNGFISDAEELKCFDHYLSHKISSLPAGYVKKRLSKLSFVKGFQEKIFRNFSVDELKEISKVWKNA